MIILSIDVTVMDAGLKVMPSAVVLDLTYMGALAVNPNHSLPFDPAWLQYDPYLYCSFFCPSQDNVDLGDLMFSLCYLPTAGRLTITVIKARNLKAMDITGASGSTSILYHSTQSNERITSCHTLTLKLKMLHKWSLVVLFKSLSKHTCLISSSAVWIQFRPMSVNVKDV